MRREDSSRRGQASAGPCRRPSCRLWVQGAAGGPGGLCVHPLRARFRKRPRPPPLPPASPFALRLRHASRHQLGSVLTPASPERGPACDLLWAIARGRGDAVPGPTWAMRGLAHLHSTSWPPPHPAVQTSLGRSAGELGTQGSVTPHPAMCAGSF